MDSRQRVDLQPVRLGKRLTTHKNQLVMKCYTGPGWDDYKPLRKTVKGSGHTILEDNIQ
jgi:hypothetical protein